MTSQIMSKNATLHIRTNAKSGAQQDALGRGCLLTKSTDITIGGTGCLHQNQRVTTDAFAIISMEMVGESVNGLSVRTPKNIERNSADHLKDASISSPCTTETNRQPQTKSKTSIAPSRPTQTT